MRALRTCARGVAAPRARPARRYLSSASATAADDGGGDENEPSSDANHCAHLVRARDADAHLCGMLLPQEARPAYFAVRAFNVEIAAIPDTARDNYPARRTFRRPPQTI